MRNFSQLDFMLRHEASELRDRFYKNGNLGAGDWIAEQIKKSDALEITENLSRVLSNNALTVAKTEGRA